MSNEWSCTLFCPQSKSGFRRAHAQMRQIQGDLMPGNRFPRMHFFFGLSVSCWRKETTTMFRPTTNCSRSGIKPASRLNASFLLLTLTSGSKRLEKTLSYLLRKSLTPHVPRQTLHCSSMVKVSTLMLQTRYNQREICYKCVTIARAFGRPHWKMRTRLGRLIIE